MIIIIHDSLQYDDEKSSAYNFYKEAFEITGLTISLKQFLGRGGGGNVSVQNSRNHQGVFLAVGVWEIPTGSLNFCQKISI